MLIPARSGSQGIRDKNIKLFNGKPLIAWSIEAAKKLKSVDNVFVSTDSSIYAQISENFGAKIPYLRPKFLAQSDTPMSRVLAYHQLAIDQVFSETKFKFCILLEPTSPLRESEHIEDALDLLRNTRDASGVISVSEPHFNPAWVTVTIDGKSRLNRWNKSGKNFTRRQDLPRVYRMNGNFYIWKVDFLRKIKDPWLEQKKFLPYIINDIYGSSIDTITDFRLAELIHHKMINDKEYFNNE